MSDLNIGIIPVRGGSKGVPRKNMRLLNKKPLLWYTIQAAQKSQLLHDFYVSSEDQEILDYCQSLNVKTVVRPRELAQDQSPTLPVVHQALQNIESELGRKVSSVVVLQATTPLRNGQDIDAAIEQLISTDATSVVSVNEMEHGHPTKAKKIENGFLVSYFGEETEGLRRQDLKKAYIRNGGIYASKRETIIEGNSIYGPKCRPYIMPIERSFDIDTFLDFEIVEALLKHEPWKKRLGI